ncbi:hypothetical protein [Breoghania sp. L-A4]|uniref:hypothetical protein n=1 Tax=Breoghania sp. L-A4 TaxID=2304600 RepID=UPI0013C315BE|nr:hypothetical protein [Breoghania sp. L-A4]
MATDPDPYDDARGVSGYMQAYAGEPDLDRIIRFQKGGFARTLSPEVGVSVRSVFVDGTRQESHPLVGAAVDLLDNPVFEGRNGVIAEDALEPVAPFNLQFRRDTESFSRGTVPSDPRIPARFREFNAVGFDIDPGLIERETGIADLRAVWRNRLSELQGQVATADPDELPGLEERITFLERNLQAGGGAARFFPARMMWDYALKSEIQEEGGGTPSLLPDFSPTTSSWRATFWFGAWDADAQMFFVSGQLEINASDVQPLRPLRRRPERLSDVVAQSDH